MNLELIISALSFVIAALAFLYSKRADDRAKIMARGNLFLELRSRFNAIYEGLPQGYREPGWRADGHAEKQAVRRYWHHCFDEWYLTNRINQKYMDVLWKEYFSDGVTAGARHDGLWEILVKMSNFKDQEKKNLWKDFYTAVEKLRNNALEN